ncbi:MAG: tRNA glutamyl-Q(34) synthetase GluQRS [Gammaproteobacteria bacterium]
MPTPYSLIVSTDQASQPPYTGRFAPSPTGPLHFGSLIAAVGSYLEARSRQGRWFVRIEDVDRPRIVPGAADAILRALERYGFCWDGPVLYQSQRLTLYQEALETLLKSGWAYPCSCTRREIAALSPQRIYPGLCRKGVLRPDRPQTIRVRTHTRQIGFRDTVQGDFAQVLTTDVGDFVIRRADGVYAYQLAVVVDDAAQGITHIVRGSDLLDSTPRQIHLQQLLKYPTPNYMHLPIALDSKGYKLSKQTGATALSLQQPGQSLYAVLMLLGQTPPVELALWYPEAIWHWAIEHWQSHAIPRVYSLSCGNMART